MTTVTSPRVPVEQMVTSHLSHEFAIVFRSWFFSLSQSVAVELVSL